MLPLINALSARTIAAYGMQSAADNEVEIVSVHPSTEVISVDSGATSSKRRKITDFFPMQLHQRDSVTASAIS